VVSFFLLPLFAYLVVHNQRIQLYDFVRARSTNLKNNCFLFFIIHESSVQ
jgi:hypothetical protein